MEAIGTSAQPRPLTRRRLTASAAALSVLTLAITAFDSGSLQRGLIAGVVSYPIMILAMVLASREGSQRSQVAGLTLVLAAAPVCSIGIGRRLPKRSGGGPAPTGVGLLVLLSAAAVAALLLAALIVVGASRANSRSQGRPEPRPPSSDSVIDSITDHLGFFLLIVAGAAAIFTAIAALEALL